MFGEKTFPTWPGHPLEEDHIRRKGLPFSKATEFRAGRACARLALRELGISDYPLLPKPSREPAWPATVCGSISHTQGAACAVVTRNPQIDGIGVDIERPLRVDPEVANLVSTSAERATAKARGWIDTDRWLAVLFSAKESAFKALFPRVQRFIDFHEVEVDLDLDARRFRATHFDRSCEGSARHLSGRFFQEPQLVVTMAILTEPSRQVWPKTNP